MVSIKMMISLGPWTLLTVDDRGPDQRDREVCEACGQQGLRYVYVVSLQAPPYGVHRIGSECGPKLLQESGTTWSAVVGRAEQLLRLLARLDRVIGFETTHARDAAWATARRELLLDGSMTEQQRKSTGGVISGRERTYDMVGGKRGAR